MSRTLFAVVLLVTLLTVTSAGASNYSIRDLGTLGGSYAIGYDIDNSGRIVGVSDDLNGNSQAFIWQSRVMKSTGTLGGPTSSGKASNDAGLIVGAADTAMGETHAFLWKDGNMQDLGTLGGWYSIANSASRSGVVVGSSYTAEGDYHAFSWTANGMVDLGTLGGWMSQANGVNSQGCAAGCSATADGNWHAVAWHAGSITDIGIPGTAASINDSDDVVGTWYVDDVNWSVWHAFIYRAGAVTDLGTLGGTYSSAYDINNLGEVVGQASLPDGRTTACLWKDGQAVDLNTLLPANSGWQLMEAYSINDSEQIAGWGLLNGQTRAFLMSPPRPIPVKIAVKPSGELDRIKLRDSGLTGVVVFAAPAPDRTEYFDVTQIDPSTVFLAGAPIATQNGRYRMQFTDVDGDGQMDLMAHVNTCDLLLPPGNDTALLVGKTFDGQDFEGNTQVIVVLSALSKKHK